MLNVFFKRILQQYLHSFFKQVLQHYLHSSEITTHNCFCAGVGDSGGAVQVQGGEEVGC